MIRQSPFRTAVSTNGRLLSTPIPRSLPFTSARCLFTETATSTMTASSPSSAASSQKFASPNSRPQSFQPASTPAASAAAPKPKVRRLTYAVERTHSKQLPVYDDSKSGGTRKFTQVRKIIGNKQDFKKDVIEELGFKMEDVVINPVTLHLIIKGHHAHKVKQWLQARGF